MVGEEVHAALQEDLLVQRAEVLFHQLLVIGEVEQAAEGVFAVARAAGRRALAGVGRGLGSIAEDGIVGHPDARGGGRRGAADENALGRGGNGARGGGLGRERDGGGEARARASRDAEVGEGVVVQELGDAGPEIVVVRVGRYVALERGDARDARRADARAARRGAGRRREDRRGRAGGLRRRSVRRAVGTVRGRTLGLPGGDHVEHLVRARQQLFAARSR